MKPVAVIGFTDVYKKPLPQDRFEYLREYPTDLIILYLSKINSILFQENDSYQQTIKIFKGVFLKEYHPDYEKILFNRINKEYEIIFSIQSISYLIKDSLMNFRRADDTFLLDIKIFQKALFDTILIYNNVTFAIDAPELETYQGIWDIAIRQQNYIRDYNALLHAIPIKFLLIQRYFQQTEEGKNILSVFQRHLGLGNFWNFAKTFMDITIKLLNNDEIGWNILTRDEIPEQAILNFSFNKEPRENVSIHFDIIPKPFYQLDDKHFAVIDFSYFRYLLDQGIFWLIYNSLSLDKNNYRNFNAFLSKIGHDYFEQFLIKKLVTNLFNKKHQIVINETGFEDFWIRPNHKELLIIEVKMVDANPLTVEAFDVDKFEKFLLSNFAKEKDSSGGAKGIHQIIRQIDILQKSPVEIQTRFKIKSLNHLVIYPIIIYSDQILDSPGVNAYIQTKFAAALHPNVNYNFSVKPVTMIGINTLIEHFHLFKEKDNNLTNMIRAYQRYVYIKQKEYIKSPSPIKYYSQNILFAEYMIKKNRITKKAEKNLAIFKDLIEKELI